MSHKNNTKELANRVAEVFLNGTWIANNNYQMLLSDVNWKEATYKIGELNSIADLTFHITYYLKGVKKVLEGGALTIRDKYSFERDKIMNEQDWQVLRSEFLKTAYLFVEAVNQLTTQQLSSTFFKKEYGTWRRNVEGIIEHGYYHLGQMVLLKKLIRANTNYAKP